MHMKTLKHLDFANGNKIIMDVCWQHLRGNSSPYLCVSVRTVKQGGVLVHSWEDQKAAIKSINPDFGLLLDHHLTHKVDASKLVQDAIDSAWSSVQKARRDIFERPITKEDYQQQIDAKISEYREFLKQWTKKNIGFPVRNVPESCKRIDASTIRGTINNIVANRLDLLPTFFARKPYTGYAYRFLLTGKYDVEDYTVYQWEKDLLQYEPLGLNTFTDNLKALLSMQKHAPSSKNVYTKQSLADKYGVAIDVVNQLLVAEDKELLKNILAPEIENQYNNLIALTDQYEIPTVTK